MGVVALVFCVCFAGMWQAIGQPGARTMMGRVFGPPMRKQRPTAWADHHLVGRRSGDGGLMLLTDDKSALPDDVQAIGEASLFLSHSVGGVWVGSQMSITMVIAVSDESGTLTPTEMLQVRRMVCDLYRPSATPAELPRLATLATRNVIDQWLDPVGAALEVLMTLMVLGAVGLGVWRFRVVRELERWERLAVGEASACPKCGYEVRGLRVCPECGVEVREQ